jgi:predicted amidophosphoribosyltransferase
MNYTCAYPLYERIQGEPCKYLNVQELIFNECPKCKKHYDLNLTHCSNCIAKKGKHKGEQFKLKKRLNNKDTCQMYRGDFHGRN